jgi:hypothetical protein
LKSIFFSGPGQAKESTELTSLLSSLVTKVEPRHGLLEALIERDVLNDIEVGRIRAVEPNVQ